MTIQSFEIYTANGYAGDLVDSGPRVIQTGILTSASVGFGMALKRDTSVDRGCAVGSDSGAVYAITQREYNHEAGVRPSTGNDTTYLETESVSMIRQGYLYVELTGATAIAAGEALHVDNVTGAFTKVAVAGDVVACTNVFADEAGVSGDIIKVRIDIA
tara:strand:- start:28 stop:504 length:477 start_codon:yes stop_codon:yes gene_type:complete